MDANLFLNVVVPATLCVIMFTLGLGLSKDDFRRVTRYPRAVAVGLATQTLLLTAVAYLIGRAFDLAPPLGVGLLLLAAAPGGAAAALYSHLARGDVALNLTLTALNSLLALAWLPLVAHWAMIAYYGASHSLPSPTHEVLQVAKVIVLPVLAGMLLRHFAPPLARTLERPSRWLAAVGIVVLLVSVFLVVRADFLDYLVAAGPAVLAFNVASLAIGYTVPRLAGLPRYQAKAIALEIGLHNATLAIYVSVTVLRDSTFAIAPVVYGVLMFATGGLFAAWLARRD